MRYNFYVHDEFVFAAIYIKIVAIYFTVSTTCCHEYSEFDEISYGASL